MMGLVLLAAGCGFLASPETTGPVVSPFPHDRHLRGLDLTCLDCHPMDAPGEPAMPLRETCEGCHDPAEEKALFARFFKAPSHDPALVQGNWVHAGRQAEEILFQHKQHLAGGQLGCLDCHAGLAAQPAVYARSNMRMARCMDCHKQRVPEKTGCAICHSTINREVKPESHSPAWLRRHGRFAGPNAGAQTAHQCALCHHESACNDCHTTQMPTSHTPHWRSRGHGHMAGIDRSACFTCHNVHQCDQCHRTVKPRDHGPGFGAPKNHHCHSCHLPLNGGDRCHVCHRDAPSHGLAVMPADEDHASPYTNNCTRCHPAIKHPDNGDNCGYCHQ